MTGRIVRAVAGIVLIVIGLLLVKGTGGWILAIVGLLPLAAGVFDWCLYCSHSLACRLGERLCAKPSSEATCD